MAKHRVLVTDYAWPSLEIERDILRAVDAELLVAEAGDEAELLSLAPDADAILTCWRQVPTSVLDAAPKCALVSRYGIGLDNIPVEHATKLGIMVANVPDFCLDEVSDHALALLLACARRIVPFAQAARAGEWNLGAGRSMRRLRGQTVGLIGFGNTARALAPKAAALGLKILAYSPRLTPEAVAPWGEAAGSLEDLLRRADFVSIHVPLTSETRGMIDEAALRGMKPSAYLINTSRGAVIDEAALEQALREGWIAGAALDVLTQEPPAPDHPLLQLENVIATPHAAFYSLAAIEELERKATQHVAQALLGQVPADLVNPAVLDHPRLRVRLQAEAQSARSTTSLDIEQHDQLLDYLRASARIEPDEMPRICNLSGGVSNRTVLVERPDGEAWVLKQALNKLRVPVDWFSPPQRVHREALGLRWLRHLAPPGAIPALLFEDYAHHLISMEAVPDPHVNWKTLLLEGRLDNEHVEQFASLLASIHRQGHERRDRLRPIFEDRSYFESLRLEPYYIYTASQVPEAAAFLHALVEATRAHTLTLVHGDYSPKNVLIHDRRLVLLDYEVIHFGDPAFDLGFSLTHLLSKAHHLPAQRAAFASAAERYWRVYREKLGDVPWADFLEQHAVRHTLACLLARVAGRSPLEYLDAQERERQRAAVTALMQAPPASVAALCQQFTAAITH